MGTVCFSEEFQENDAHFFVLVLNLNVLNKCKQASNEFRALLPQEYFYDVPEASGKGRTRARTNERGGSAASEMNRTSLAVEVSWPYLCIAGEVDLQTAPSPLPVMDLSVEMAKLSVSDKGDSNEPATHFKSTAQVVSSYCEISIGPNAQTYRYEVDIIATSPKGQEKNLTRGPSDDGASALRRRLCDELLRAATKKSNGLGTSRGSKLPIVYDGRSTLFLPFELEMNMELVVALNEDSDYADMSEETLFALDPNDVIRVRIARTTRSAFKMNLQQEMMKAEILEAEEESSRDRSFRTFLEMLTSVHAINTGSHTALGVGNFFDNDPKLTRDIGDGKYLRPGLSKGVRVVEKDGRPYPALVLDAKSCAFFKPQNLADSVLEFRKKSKSDDDMWKAVRFQFKDVRVTCNQTDKYNKGKSFAIRGITKVPATAILMKTKQFEGTLAEYYTNILKIKLRYPHFMCVEAEIPSSRKDYYPLEVLFVAPNQRVPIEKTEANQSSVVLKANAIRPQERILKIREQMVRMGLMKTNSTMKEFNVFVCPDFIQLQAGVRVAPKIAFGDRTIQIDQKKASWSREANGSTFREESFALERWTIVYSNAPDQAVIQQFARRFVAAANRRKFRVSDPTIVRFSNNLDGVLTEVAEQGIPFVMLVDPIYTKTHDSLKLFERMFCVLTQHVTLERVFDVVQKNSRTTLENILSKTHMKLGGLNYTPVIEKIGNRFALDSGDVLVIGYDVAHPTAVSAQERRLLRSMNTDIKSLEPSVVGITANCNINPHEFIGDYHYQTARKESIDVRILEDRMVWIMQMLETNRPQHSRPKHIVILRDGISEGQYSMAVTDEMASLREGLKRVDPCYNPTFTLVVATKRHNKRFFGTDGRGYVNTEPGTVIDNTVVRTDVPEFFLQSHYPLQGTAKIPQYNKLYDEANFTMDELQAFVNCLCHTHQIVNLAISIPEPIYQADELAKRGKNNFNEYRRRFDVPCMEGGLVNCATLTKELSYWNTPLGGLRFTA
uniref:Piwi domain-containing protein n=1 Tax=Steinernema glaseri TaxID=37863 RepID=A0A1I8A3L1_9BILA